MTITSGWTPTTTRWTPRSSAATVEIAAGLEEVTVTCQGRQVARHPRCWAAHQSITDPAHAAAAAQLRQARRLLTARPADTDVQQRALADYDRILGTAGDQGAA